MKYLQGAIERAVNIVKEDVVPTQVMSSDEVVLANALKSANQKFNINEESDGYTKLTADKGLYGNKTLVFKCDVYKVSKEGDVSSKAGLVTPSDLEKHIRFRKGDQLTFRWESGETGACCYTAKGNAQDDYNDEFKWTDALIRDLIDEDCLSES